jgi:hypothetical protein
MTTHTSNNSLRERDINGLFCPGNQIAKGRGNPHAREAVRLRAALYVEITPERWREVIQAMYRAAIGTWCQEENRWADRPNVNAATWIADRLIGKPVETGDEERLRRVEEALGLGHDLSPENVTAILERAEGAERQTAEGGDHARGGA